MSPDPLPPVPIWFPKVVEDWQPYESCQGVLNAVIRRKQLERLREAKHIEFTCRTYNAGKVNIYARLAPRDTEWNP